MGEVGRPSKFRPEFCVMIINHMKSGLSVESFAGVVGVCEDTLYEWKRVHPEFSEAIKIGKPMSRLFWEREGIAGMWEGKQFNPAVWYINMKNRFGWKDKPEELSASESKPIVIQLAYDRGKPE